MKILWLDTETTGLDCNKHGIVQLAMIIDIDNKVVDKKTFLMNPTDRLMDKKALEVNGYNEEQIKKFTPWNKVHDEVISFLSLYVNKFDKKDKFILAGQNVGFDNNFMKAWFESCEDKYWYSWVQSGAFIDTFFMLTFLQWCGKIPLLENRKNETICKHFDIDLTNAHDDMADIEATRAVACEMRDLIIRRQK